MDHIRELALIMTQLCQAETGGQPQLLGVLVVVVTLLEDAECLPVLDLGLIQ